MSSLQQEVMVVPERRTRSSRRRRRILAGSSCRWLQVVESTFLLFVIMVATSSKNHHQYHALAFSVSTTTTREQSSSAAATTSSMRSTMSATVPTTTATTTTETTETTETTSDHELLLSAYQQQAAPIVRSFEAGRNDDCFDPPAWLRNCHVQTILGFLWREKGRGGSYVRRGESPLQTVGRLLLSPSQQAQESSSAPPEPFWHHRERIETPDGDWFHADSRTATFNADGGGDDDDDDASNARKGRGGTVIIVHGLESNTDSPAVQQMAVAFERSGCFDTVVGLNFRGCSGAPNDTLGGYHLGFTDDLRQYLDLLKERSGSSDSDSDSAPPVYLAGFSLGANVVLKCLGELGARAATDYRIRGAAVLCAPLDQRLNAPKLASPGINKEIYSKNLMRTMKERVQYSVDRFCDGNTETDRFDYRKAMAASDIMEIEDAFLAPVYGFRDCWDYYDQTSSIHFLDGIAVPTLILNAEDDPFLDATTWPLEKSVDHGGSVPLKLVRTRYGGHLGYFLHQVDDENDERLRDAHAPSWAAVELGRFLGHVQREHSQQTRDNR